MTQRFETIHVCEWSGARHLSLPLSRTVPAVYVGHPVTGIAMRRIRAMEAETVAALEAAAGGDVDVLFPMRSTHLGPDATGANEYEGAPGLFTQVRHFTLQNRTDAVFAADAVLLNYDLADDAGTYRMSRGIPFDLGWANSRGIPVVAVIDPSNPNWWPGLPLEATVVPDLATGAALVAKSLSERARKVEASVDVYDFTGCPPAPAMLARLAAADARKASGTCAAIVTVMPEGRENANWHGQVLQVSDWIVSDLAEAMKVAAVLLGRGT